MGKGKGKGKDKKNPGGEPERNVMSDGSISWGQPESNGLFGWEGFCGQTAIANLLTTYKGIDISPHDVAAASNDWTPGSDPDTLMRAIGALATDPETYVISNDTDLSSASPTTPIVVLLHWGGTDFHYVTVVKATDAEVTFNHWGKQETLPTAVFHAKWSFRDAQTEARVMGWSPYTSIRKTK